MPQMTSPHPVQPVALDPERKWLSDQGRAHAKAAELAGKIDDAASSGKRIAPMMRNALRQPQARLSAALKALGRPPCREPLCLLWDV